MSEARARVLDALQDDLERIYAVRAPMRASDFAIDRGELLSHRGAERAPEELLVRHNAGGLEVGLYVSDEVVARLASPGPWTAARLAAHCAAAEGVSHFVYLTLRADADRQVSQLELEAQAEVDKYATVLFSLWERGNREASGELRSALFESVRYREHLAGAERERYRLANFLAATYTRLLELRYVARGAFEAMLRELRRLWRLGAGEKLSHLARPLALG